MRTALYLSVRIKSFCYMEETHLGFSKKKKKTNRKQH